MVVFVKPVQVPPFVELSCWRKQFIGLLMVSHPSEADTVMIRLPGMDQASVIELSGNGRAQFEFIMDALSVAFELGRRDVIDKVRGIFTEKPAR
jgi:hypothetical protein